MLMFRQRFNTVDAYLSTIQGLLLESVQSLHCGDRSFSCSSIQWVQVQVQVCATRLSTTSFMLVRIHTYSPRWLNYVRGSDRIKVQVLFAICIAMIWSITHTCCLLPITTLQHCPVTGFRIVTNHKDRCRASKRDFDQCNSCVSLNRCRIAITWSSSQMRTPLRHAFTTRSIMSRDRERICCSTKVQDSARPITHSHTHMTATMDY